MLVVKLFNGLLACSFLASATPQVSAEDFKATCESFRPEVPDVTLEFTQHIQAEATVDLPYVDKTCGGPQISGKVGEDICRVTMYITTSAQSGIHLEAWFPKTWNGRFLATGNGGLGGCMSKTRQFGLCL